MLSLSPLHLFPPKLSSLTRTLSLPPLSLSCASPPSSLRRLRRRLEIRAIDAAQFYDYESKLAADFQSSTKLKIAIVGFGNFGQFLARTFVQQGHTVLAHSRSDHSRIAETLGVSFFSDADDLCEEHPEVILLCTSIISTENVLKSLPLQRLRRSTLIVDVLSVKEFPKNLLLNLLPNDFDLICTHPMFGPESARNGWNGLFFVYDKVRIGAEESRVLRCESFLGIFEKEGCEMVEMSCAEHDRFAAESQFITHTVGRVLEGLKLESTPINTKGYETLLNLVENTAADSFDLYYGLFVYNKNSLVMLERLDLAFEALKNLLFGRLHDVVRKQLFGGQERLQISREEYRHSSNGAALPSSSEATRQKSLSSPLALFYIMRKISFFYVEFSGFGVSSLVEFSGC